MSMHGARGAAASDPWAAEALPGPYDPFSYQVQEDPYPFYAWMREHAPVYRNEERDFFALSRHADVLAAMRDPATFTNRDGISLEPTMSGPQAYKNVFFLALDPPDHTVVRGLIQRVFSPRAVVRREPRIRELTRRRLRPLLDRDTFDFAADLATPVSTDGVCEMLGIPESDWDTIRQDSDLLNTRKHDSDERTPANLAAAFRLGTYYKELVADMRRRPGDNLISMLTQAEIKGRPVRDEEIIAFIFLIVSGGNESTSKLVGNAWYHGWRVPGVQRAGLAGRFRDWTSETLRFDSSSQMTSRTTTRDLVLHGTTVPAGSRVVLLHASGNRDHRVFDDPDRFDLDRDTRKMISFGAGPHFCLGAALSTLEIPTVLEEVARHVAEYDLDMAGSRRVHSAHQRGFMSLPCSVVWRKDAPDERERG
ncbi:MULTISPECIES: cytochrome P450 [unclassified Nonomuraea]|uniref:cytochrome P450 n=1 Tax=unclassified Nonomuraea TaxID=2593643 RepID=UPI0035BF6D6C